MSQVKENNEMPLHDALHLLYFASDQSRGVRDIYYCRHTLSDTFCKMCHFGYVSEISWHILSDTCLMFHFRWINRTWLLCMLILVESNLTLNYFSSQEQCLWYVYHQTNDTNQFIKIDKDTQFLTMNTSESMKRNNQEKLDIMEV